VSLADSEMASALLPLLESRINTGAGCFSAISQLADGSTPRHDLDNLDAIVPDEFAVISAGIIACTSLRPVIPPYLSPITGQSHE
jgi:hypothetical protein